MPKKILIVESNPTERAFLSDYSKNDFDIFTASGSKEMTDVLRERAKSLSAIIIDIASLENDGYSALRIIRTNAIYSQIPVITLTKIADDQSHLKALALGASANIAKPVNKSILVCTIENILTLRENSALMNTFRKDMLTGLLNRKAFFEAVGERIRHKEAGFYTIACFDIENFKVINDQFGVSVGDTVLKHVASKIDKCVTELDGVCCRYSADKFGMLYPTKYKDSKEINDLHSKISQSEHLYGGSLRVRIGRYLIDDLFIPVSAMFDRATLAEESIRDRYDIYIAEYTDSMRIRILSEQKIVNDMNRALEEGEFEPWFQPQYNHATNALIGAEALARWKKNGKYIPPAEFIPVFERNGFIYKMDQYIWEQVCKLMRKWLDEGREVLPVSINISRRDLFHKHFISVLTDIIKRYDLDYQLIRLEVTESAFSESSQIVKKVEELIGMGFVVEIDDFGSGYSSLNTLKDVPASILKLDMRFFENTKDSQRGGNIIESVVRMAKWLGMAVIAEGVEEKSQADYLKSIGCFYIQGYYYSRPIPVEDYERLLSRSSKEEELTRLKTLETLDNNEFWNPKSMDTLIFNSYVGGACIFEYHDGKTELLRVNDQYALTLRNLVPESGSLNDLSPIRYLDEKNKRSLFQNICNAISTKKEATCVLMLSDTQKTPPHTEYVRATCRVIAHAVERYLLYCVIVNITPQYIAEQKRHEAELMQAESAMRLEFIMRNINGGVSAIIINDDGTSHFVFNNERYYELYGYTREQAAEEVLDVMNTIIPEDFAVVMKKIKKLKKDRKPVLIDYRIKKRDGSLALLRANASLMRVPGWDDDVITSIVTDITEKKSLEEKLTAIVNNINGGVTATIIRDGKPEFVIVNEQFFKILGYNSREQYDAEMPDKYSGIHPDDRERIIKQFECSDGGKKQYTMEYRVIRRDGKIRYIKNNISVVRLFGVDEPVQLSVANDVTAEKEAHEQLKFLNNSAHDILARPDSDLAINKTLENLMRYFSGDRSYVIELDHENRVTNNTYEKCADGVESEMQLLQNVPFSVSDYWFDTLNKNEFIVIDNVDGLDDSKAELRALLLKQDIHSIIVAPLCRDGILVGFVGIDNPTNAVHHLDHLKALADYIAILITRRDLSLKIKQDNNQLQLLTNSIPGGLATFVCSKEHSTLKYYNEGFCELLGYIKEEFNLNMSGIMNVIFAEDRPLVDRNISQIVNDGKPIDCIFRIRTKSGSFKWVNQKAIVVDRDSNSVVVNAVFLDITEHEEEKEKLRVSEEFNRIAMEHSGNIITRFDVNARTLTLPDSFNKIFVIEHVLKNMPEEQVTLGRISPDTADIYCKMFEDIVQGSAAGTATYKQNSTKGWRWLEAQYTTVFSSSGKPVSAVISFTDITEKLEKEVVYNKWQQSLNERDEESYTLFRCNLSKGTSFDSWQGKLLKISFDTENKTFDERTGEYVDRYVYEDDRDKYLAFMNCDTLLARYYRGHRTGTLDYREKCGESQIRWLRLTVDMVEYPSSKDIEIYMMYEDIDEQKKADLLTLKRSQTDPLTGTLNRSTFISKMEHILQSSPAGKKHALMMLDIDNFKQINDTLGHGVGDNVLKELTVKINSILRRDDLMGRLGGDEFFVFLNDIPNSAAAAAKAKQICELNVCADIPETNVTVSVGIAMIPKNGNSFDELYKKVDATLYLKKETGKAGYLFVK